MLPYWEKITVGIVAKVCTYLAENQINILDISQTIIQGYFNMMVIADVTDLSKDFTVVCDEMEQLGPGDRREHPLPERRDF